MPCNVFLMSSAANTAPRTATEVAAKIVTVRVALAALGRVQDITDATGWQAFSLAAPTCSARRWEMDRLAADLGVNVRYDGWHAGAERYAVWFAA